MSKHTITDENIVECYRSALWWQYSEKDKEEKTRPWIIATSCAARYNITDKKEIKKLANHLNRSGY